MYVYPPTPADTRVSAPGKKRSNSNASHLTCEQQYHQDPATAGADFDVFWERNSMGFWSF